MTPHGLGVVRLDHVNVTSPEDLIEEVTGWYANCLGLQRLEKPEGTRPQGAWFQAGDEEIHVSVDEHNPPEKAHFGIVVSDFEAAVGQLRGAGCHLEQANPIPGRRRCFTRDPAGNRIEIIGFDEPPAMVEYEETPAVRAGSPTSRVAPATEDALEAVQAQSPGPQ